LLINSMISLRGCYCGSILQIWQRGRSRSKPRNAPASVAGQPGFLSLSNRATNGSHRCRWLARTASNPIGTVPKRRVRRGNAVSEPNGIAAAVSGRLSAQPPTSSGSVCWILARTAGIRVDSDSRVGHSGRAIVG